jgi:hypothetical protein
MKAETQNNDPAETIVETTNEGGLMQSDGWIRIAPLGDFRNVGRRKTADGQIEEFPIIQRIDAESLNEMVAESKSLVGKVRRFFKGVPIYAGHPDGLGVGKTYKDAEPKGMIAEIEARNDGLYGRPIFNESGEALLEATNGLAPSARFEVAFVGERKNPQLTRPIRLRSVGLTKAPNLPVETINEAKPDSAPISEPQSPQEMTIEQLKVVVAPLGIEATNDTTAELIGTAFKTKLETVQAEATNAAKDLEALKARIAETTNEIATVRGELIAEALNNAQESGRISQADRQVWQGRLTTNFAAERRALGALTPKWNTAALVQGDRKAESANSLSPMDAFMRIVDTNYEKHPMRKSNPGKAYDAAWAEAKLTHPELVTAAGGK